MVGDVKQSIYRFRLADPDIFLRKYSAYPDAADAAPGEPRKLLLSDNFRSREEVLAAANDVFSLVMNRESCELDYGEAERLRAGMTFPPVEGPWSSCTASTSTTARMTTAPASRKCRRRPRLWHAELHSF